jgi:hypothetical protein
MAFGRASNSRVARHEANLIDILGDEKGRVSQAGAGERGLDAGMTTANHNDVKLWHSEILLQRKVIFTTETQSSLHSA